MNTLLFITTYWLSTCSHCFANVPTEGGNVCDSADGDACTAAQGAHLLQVKGALHKKDQIPEGKKMLWHARKDLAKKEGLLQAWTENERARTRAKSFLALCDQTIVDETCEDLKEGIDDDIRPGHVSEAVLQEELSSGPVAVTRLWSLLGLKENYGRQVHCKKLCLAAVSYLGNVTTLPETSDKACYTVDDGSIKCDIDVSPAALAAVEMKGDMPDTGDEEIYRSNGSGASLLQGHFPRFERHASPDAPSMIEQGEAQEKHGNEGRASRGRVDHADLKYTDYELVERVANFFRIFPVADPSKEDGVSFVYTGSIITKAQQACRDTISRVSTKSKVWVGTVIDKVTKQHTAPLMHKWFGQATSGTRVEVMRILNEIDNMLGSVEYVLPGDQCDPTVYGYVYPHGPKSHVGNKKIIHLCDLFCSSIESVQIETITHEGAHHGPAFLDDIYGLRSYGRTRCMEIARDTPADAIKNADSMCYYIADVAMEANSPNAGNGCGYARDGSCDEPNYCLPGTDTADCANSPPATTPAPTASGDTCPYANDGGCDVPTYCREGSDVVDCRTTDACAYANDGSCDVPQYCPSGSDVADCSR